MPVRPLPTRSPLLKVLRARVAAVGALLGSTAIAGACLGLAAPVVLSAPPSSAQGQTARSCPGISEAPRLLKDGFRWSEGPIWVASEQHWVFSDVMGDRQYTITPAGSLKVFRQPSGYANGNNLSPKGFLVSAQHDRQLVAVNLNGKVLRVLANSYQGKKLNSPNGVAIAADDSIWFTDPPMGINGYGPVKAPQELPYQGVFRLSRGQLTLMDASFGLPNGIAFAPDGRRLYVSDTKDNSISVFRVSADSTHLKDKRLFARLTPVPGGGKDGVADGLKVDHAGNVWATGPGGITVFDPSGSIRCQIPFPAHVADLAFGGRNGNLILVASADKLYLIKGKQAF
ncbi:MAG: SMP-30/gluconolactonase/LRE family protein [Cyanobium sp.]